MKVEIYKLLAIRTLRAFLLIMPIITLYWMDLGLTIQDIFVLQVIFSVAAIVLEIPSGYFADTFGRKKSIVFGICMATIGHFLYFTAEGFWGFALAETVLAFSAAFVSGADSAFLFDTLIQYKSSDLHVKYEGLMMFMSRIAEATAAIGSSILLLFMTTHAIFLVQFIVTLLAIPIALSLREPTVPNSFKKKKNVVQIVKFALHENRKLLYLNVFSGLIGASTLMMVWFAQPYWVVIGIPVVYFGVLWALMNIMVSIGSYFAYQLTTKLSFKNLFLFFALTPLVLFGLLSFGLGLLSLLVISAFWVTRGLFHPIALDYINRETDSSIRATVLSVSNLFVRLFFSIFSPFLGWVADIYTLETAFLAAAVIVGLLTLCAFAFLLKEMLKKTDPQMV
jgi:MFS family permease